MPTNPTVDLHEIATHSVTLVWLSIIQTTAIAAFMVYNMFLVSVRPADVRAEVVKQALVTQRDIDIIRAKVEANSVAFELKSEWMQGVTRSLTDISNELRKRSE